MIDRSIDWLIDFGCSMFCCWKPQWWWQCQWEKERKSEKMWLVGCEKWFSGKLPGFFGYIFTLDYRFLFSFNEVKILLFLRHRHRFVYRIESKKKEKSRSTKYFFIFGAPIMAINKPKLKLKKNFSDIFVHSCQLTNR